MQIVYCCSSYHSYCVAIKSVRPKSVKTIKSSTLTNESPNKLPNKKLSVLELFMILIYSCFLHPTTLYLCVIFYKNRKITQNHPNSVWLLVVLFILLEFAVTLVTFECLIWTDEICFFMSPFMLEKMSHLVLFYHELMPHVDSLHCKVFLQKKSKREGISKVLLLYNRTIFCF